MPASRPRRKAPARAQPPPAPAAAKRKAAAPKTDKAKTGMQASSDPSTALARRTPEQLIPTRADPEYEKLLADADAFADAAYAQSTERAYTSDFEDWKAFARRHPKAIPPPYMPITPDQLRAYIADLAARPLSIATIRRRCAALSKLHRISSLRTPTKDPAVLRALQGLVRKRSVRPTKKDALRLPHLFTVIRHRKSLLRDKTLLLVGLLTGMRRSELVAVKWSEVSKTPAGIQIEIAKSKTDQEGHGAIVPLLNVDNDDLCPVRMLEKWREHTRGEPEDRVFPFSDRTVARIVQRAVRLCGQDPKTFSGHSIRSGFMTLCSELGVPLHDAMEVSRHLTRTVAEGYVRGQMIMKNPAAVALARALSASDRRSAMAEASPKTGRPERRKASR